MQGGSAKQVCINYGPPHGAKFLTYRRNVARCLVERCQNLYEALERYEKKPIPDSTVQPRDAVFKSVAGSLMKGFH